MILNNTLEVFIITYNREKYLRNTLAQIFDEQSPIKNCKITVLDNASSDGTSSLVKEYSLKHSNLFYEKKRKNIGGNANLCEAYAKASFEYAWVLCDDDKYCWDDWYLVERYMSQSFPCICLGGDASHNLYDANILDHQYALIYALTYTPLCIFRTDAISDTLLANMYESTYSLFPQLVLPIYCVNNDIKIPHLNKCVVEFCRDTNTDGSYYRGSLFSDCVPRREFYEFCCSFASILQYVENHDIAFKSLEYSMDPHFGGKEKFYNFLINIALNQGAWNFFGDVFSILPPQDKSYLLEQLDSRRSEVLSSKINRGYHIKSGIYQIDYVGKDKFAWTREIDCFMTFFSSVAATGFRLCFKVPLEVFSDSDFYIEISSENEQFSTVCHHFMNEQVELKFVFNSIDKDNKRIPIKITCSRLWKACDYLSNRTSRVMGISIDDRSLRGVDIVLSSLKFF